MLHKLDMGRFRDNLRRYFKGSESLAGQPLPEVNKALIEDAPRVVRLTIWGVIAFFLFLIVWASVAPIDEVTRGEGKAILSSKVQKIQNLEGGIVAEIFAKEGRSSKSASRCCAWTRPASPPTSTRPRPRAWPWPCACSA